jgi:hypothetical protein
MTTADASLPLTKAINDALKAAGVAGGRVYDGAPASPQKPYTTIGPMDVLTEAADEYEGSDTTLQVDAWSAGPGSVEIKQIGRLIRATLHEATLTLEEHQRLVSLTVDQIRYLREPDGITQHAAISVRARTEPTA